MEHGRGTEKYFDANYTNFHECPELRAVQEIQWSFGKKRRGAVFMGVGVVSARSQGWQTCSFAEASPKPQNPRSEQPQYFLNRSKTQN
jgi:hypothetical protein